MKSDKDGWSPDPARREVAQLRERLAAVKLIAMGSGAVAILSLILAGVALFKGDGKADRFNATRIEATEIHCRSLRVSDKSIDPNRSLVFMPELGGPVLFQDGKEVWDMQYTSAGIAQNFYDSKGKLRMTLGCAATRNKNTDDETLSSPGTLTLFKADGSVIWMAP